MTWGTPLRAVRTMHRTGTGIGTGVLGASLKPHSAPGIDPCHGSWTDEDARGERQWIVGVGLGQNAPDQHQSLCKGQ